MKENGWHVSNMILCISFHMKIDEKVCKLDMIFFIQIVSGIKNFILIHLLTSAYYADKVSLQAKLNVLKGRYRIANADAEMLGGILACIEHGKFDREKHAIGFFRYIAYLHKYVSIIINSNYAVSCQFL